MNRFALALTVLLYALPVFGQEQKDSMKDCSRHNHHHAVVENHGDKAMGFPHDKTTHHFRLMSDGGSIEVAANDSGDKTNKEAIRSHLSHIAAMFSKGDFSTPMFIHDGIPPGVTTMKLMKSAIHYSYEETTSGGSVKIRSDDPIGVAAIHDFLRYQITEHHTGDSVQVAQE
jgi:hypothetical protein